MDKQTWKLSEDDKVAFVRRYQAGESSHRIARAFDVAPSTVCDVLNKYGVRMRRSGPPAIHAVNHAAFDALTSDACYWAGFLWADGHLTQSGRVVKTGLAIRDYGHLVKLRDFLGSTHAISRSQTACQFSVSSKPIVTRLRWLGLKDGPVAPELASSHHFWRGLVDGNGSLGVWANKVGIRIGDPRKFLLDSFREFVAVDIPARAMVRNDRMIYALSFGGRPAISLIAKLYSDAPTSLDRKQARADKILGDQRTLTTT